MKLRLAIKFPISGKGKIRVTHVVEFPYLGNHMIACPFRKKSSAKHNLLHQKNNR